MNTHRNVEKAFDSLAGFVVRRSWITLLLGLGATLVLLSGLPRVRPDSSFESLLAKGDVAIREYDRFQQQFGQDQYIVVAVQADEIFDIGFLAKLRAFHEELEESVPHVDEVTSLWNARHTHADGQTLVIDELGESWPDRRDQVDDFEAMVLANPIYRNTILSRSGEIAAIVIKPGFHADATAELAGFDTPPSEAATGDAGGPGTDLEHLHDDEKDELLGALREAIARNDRAGFRIRIAGPLPDGDHVNTLLATEAGRAFLSSLVVSILVLALLFRRVSACATPLLVIALSAAGTFGLMGLMGIPLSAPMAILPRLINLVAAASAIYLLTLVFQQLDEGDSKQSAIRGALVRAGPGIAVAGLTTAAGLASFVFVGLAPVAQFGVVGSLGILITVAYSCVVLPALVAVLPVRASKRRTAVTGVHGPLARWLSAVGVFAGTRPWRVMAATALLLVLCAVGIGRLHVSQHPISWLPEEDPTRQTVEFIDREFGGTSSLEVLVDTGRRDGLKDAPTLARIGEAVERARGLREDGIFVGNALSVVDIVEEIHQALSGGDPRARRLPADSAVISQELLLFEMGGSDDVEEWVDSDFRTARISLTLPDADGVVYLGFIDRLRDELSRVIGDRGEISMTGTMFIVARSMSMLSSAMISSYAIALAAISLIMIFVIGSVRVGALSMVPNVVPVLFTLGLIGWLGIPLDSSTLLIGCLVLGLAVDDTIHFMHRFNRFFGASGSVRGAIDETLRSTGVAMLSTSVVLFLGFTTSLASYLVNIVQFGVIAGFATVVALLADLLVAPALLAIFVQDRPAQLRDDLSSEVLQRRSA